MLALPFDQDTLAQWRGKLPAMLEVAAVLLLALQSARLLWLVLTPTGPVGVLESDWTTATRVPSLAGNDVFFRQMTTDTSTRGAAQAQGYTLFGVRGAGTDSGSAILADIDGQQSTYRVGDTIAPGLVLVAVGVDHAVLGSGSNRERIDFPDRPASTSTPSTATQGSLPTGAPSRSAAGPAAIDPQQLLAQAGLRPRSEGGYTVIPRGDGALLRQAGLQSGDVLLSVNGQSLTPERLGELSEELKGQSQVEITFERDGQSRAITLPGTAR